MGWYSIRREMKKMMIVFLAIGFIITSGWAIMFYSIVYRWFVPPVLRFVLTLVYATS